MKDKKHTAESLRQAVYEIAALIPRGRATSYGAIARAAGYPNMSRAVGRLMAGIKPGAGIPAHRVVNSQGMLSGRQAFDRPDTMQKLLEGEGIVVRSNRIMDWKKVFWDPITEIEA